MQAATNPRRLTDEQAELVSAHWKRATYIARHFAKQHSSLNLPFDSAAAFGLCDAARRYRGGNFWTYASRCVWCACLEMLRRNRLRGYVASKDQPPEIHPILATDESLARDDTSISMIDSVDFVSGLTNGLRPVSREVINLHYFYGLDMKSIAERLGFSAQYAYKVHGEAIEHLRKSVAVSNLVRRAS